MLSDERFTGFNSNPVKLKGTHALFSPSSPSWLRYTEDKVIDRLRTSQAAALGTELHETAASNIKNGIKLALDGKYPILAAYVNDAIDLGMTPEQDLFYSYNFYGTADAVDFDLAEMFLRIHDYKSGISKPSVDQLYVYAALFCLEYNFKPFEINGELRIYQRNPVDVYEIDRLYLAKVYEIIRSWNDLIERRRMEGLV